MERIDLTRAQMIALSGVAFSSPMSAHFKFVPELSGSGDDLYVRVIYSASYGGREVVWRLKPDGTREIVTGELPRMTDTAPDPEAGHLTP